MAIAPEQKNPLDLVRGWRAKIGARTGITNFSADSVTRALMDVLAQEVSQVRQSQLESFYASQLSRASGKQLDLIGEDMGLPRLQPTFSSASVSEHNFAFYVETGTFGSINGGSSITIPVGTILYSDQNQNELNARVEYETIQSVTLSAANAIGYCGAKAVTAGPFYNVGANVIRNHNFSGYVGAGAGGLKVMNFFAVLNGRSQEPDDRYRFRLSRNYDRLISRNDSRIMLNALQVPGVLDVKILPGFYGIGTSAVVVLGPDYEVSLSLIAAVQSQLDVMSVPGLRVLATPATKVQLDLQLELSPIKDLSALERRQIETDVRRVLKNLLRSVEIGGTVSLKELEKAVHENARAVLKMGRRTGSEVRMFKNVYIRRGAATGTMSERELLLLTSVTLEPQEFFDLGTVEFSYQ
jgi:uncharacterized phage protein gp47/JayE